MIKAKSCGLIRKGKIGKADAVLGLMLKIYAIKKISKEKTVDERDVICR
jgi:hypothetical protein